MLSQTKMLFLTFLFCFGIFNQGGMSSAWQRRVQGRLVLSLCLSSSPCWLHLRGSTHSSWPPPESWPSRSLSSLRLWAPASGLNVVRVNCFVGTVKTFCSYMCFLSPLISVAAVIVGGIDMMAQSLVLAKKPHVVIGKKERFALIFHRCHKQASGNSYFLIGLRFFKYLL